VNNVIQSGSTPIGGLSLLQIFRSEIVRVNRWQCVVGEQGATTRYEPRLDILSFTRSGAFTLHAGRESAVIDANHAMFMLSGESYTMANTFGRRSFGYSLAFHPDLTTGIAPRLRHPATAVKLPAIVARDVSPHAYLLHSLLIERLQRGVATSPLEIEESALLIAGQALRPQGADEKAQVKPLKSRQPREIVEEAKALLAANCRQAIRLVDIARTLDLSPFHLCRLFTRHAGLGMHRYLTRLRLRAALEDVADPRASLTDVALEHGFSSQSHFTDAFRAEFGMTPRQVRGLASRAHLRSLSDSLALSSLTS
jgi:AraC-like DNA-binding protein